MKTFEKLEYYSMILTYYNDYHHDGHNYGESGYLDAGVLGRVHLLV